MFLVKRFSVLAGVRLVASLFVSCLIGATVVTNVSAEQEDGLFQALSVRHFSPAVAELEKLAGGRDALVVRLLELRNDARLPFVSIRAEKLLLGFADRPEVAEALAADLDSNERRGLARAVALHLSSVSDSGVRRTLARTLVERAKRDGEFVRYARELAASDDSELKRMAREIP